jgi:hypothetical protein
LKQADALTGVYSWCKDVNQIYTILLNQKPEALKSLYRSPGSKKKQLVLCKNYVLQW